MKTDELSPQQSLDLIANMIQQAKGNVSNNGRYYLLWGWCITLANLGMYAIIKLTTWPHPYLVWLITIPAWIISLIFGMKDNKKAVHTHLDTITMWLWIGFGITIIPVIVFGYKINFQINAIILVFSSLPTFISGIILRFKPLIFGGVLFWICGALCFLTDSTTQYLIGGMAMTLGYLLPGYLLKKAKD